MKIIDFGFAYEFKNEEDTQHKKLGTAHYMAPEVVLRQNYNEKSDVWSLGIILYYLLTGHKPYDGETVDDIFKAIIHNDFIESINLINFLTFKIYFKNLWF